MHPLRIALVAVTLAAVAPLANSADHPPPGGKVFRFRLPFEPQTLDWHLGDVPIPITQNIMRGLFKVDAKGNVVPDLVDTFESKDGGKRWLFRMKTKIKWSDGVEFTSHHAAEGLRRLLDPRLASSYAYFLFDVEGAKSFYSGKSKQIGIRAPSERELEITLQTPIAFFPAILTHWVTFPIRSELLEKYPDYWRNPERIATLGAFKIQRWIQNTRIVLAANPHAEEKPWLERVEGWIVTEDQTALNLFDSGQLDFISDPGTAGMGRSDLVHRPSPILYFVGIGPGHPFSSKPQALRALSLALQRSEIPQALSVPHRPATKLVPPEIPPEYSNQNRSFDADVGQAQTLMAAAGFKEPAGVPVIRLRFFNRPAIAELAQWVQAQWKKNLGLRVELEGSEIKSYWSQLAKSPEAFFINSKGAAYPDADTFFRLFASENGTRNAQNLGRWMDRGYDRRIEQAASTSEPSARAKLYNQAEKILLEEKPGLIPLYFRSSEYLIKPYVEGLVINPLSSIFFEKIRYPDHALRRSAR
jgi:ABC-type oligopeptide transport system substrate-binding subunit